MTSAAQPRKLVEILSLTAFSILVVCAGVFSAFDVQLRQMLEDSLGRTLTQSMIFVSTHFLTNPWFYAIFLGVILLERAVPAAEGQRLFSRGLGTDVIWVLPKLLFHATLMPLYVITLQQLFERYFGGMSLTAMAQWPAWARVTMGLLVGDFVFWVTHIVRHKVRALWYFHAVHHSQRELNFFTEYRVHPVDDVFIFTIGVLPIMMVSESVVTIVAIVWIRHWHTRIYHSNIRTNFGWLRYLLVTPQSHRVHHSIEPRHQDTNFGLTFSLWDYLFGTQYRGYDEYPETGIQDADFPAEQGELKLAGAGNVLAQLFYPFRALARG